ncbi:ribose-5-phosphate isomerase RpiA [Sphingomonas sp. PAMC 26605]|uniref:ribose-5-phosphate isomerase RpiA n=1 Tax=Sphingomonas sp. PAMC 26605 TaxID=1112214 RepID=UPI00026CD5BE|nr:ribose-5-phosphate isomerase RpiA [Sphingomonas sp. PAMC 26605]
MNESDKRLAALAAVAEVRPGMIVGLGTGSTAAFAIAALGEQVRAGLQVQAVATSLATEASAREAGITLIEMPARIDLTIDGADEIDDALRAIKGAGGAMLREKVVAAASERMIVIADGSKQVAAIGAAKIPVEVLPFAQAFVADRLADLGGAPTLRAGFTSDQGNPILDCRFPADIDHAALAAAIAAIPGALGHGLFLCEVDAAYIATDGVVTRLERGDAKA